MQKKVTSLHEDYSSDVKSSSSRPQARAASICDIELAIESSLSSVRAAAGSSKVKEGAGAGESDLALAALHVVL